MKINILLVEDFLRFFQLLNQKNTKKCDHRKYDEMTENNKPLSVHITLSVFEIHQLRENRVLKEEFRFSIL